MDATCFYVGHILRSMTANNTRELAAFDRAFANAIKVANVSDRYVTSPVLQAYKRCLTGPASLLEPPDWLGQSFGQVSIDQGPGGAGEGTIGEGSTGEGTISGGDLGEGTIGEGTVSEGNIAGVTLGGSAVPTGSLGLAPEQVV